MTATAGAALITNGSVSGTQVNWAGGIGVFAAVGTFGGATVKLQFIGPDGVTLVDAGAATTLTANGAGVFYLPPGPVQGTIVGGAPSAIFASVSRVIN